jgi:hypothetical protein
VSSQADPLSSRLEQIAHRLDAWGCSPDEIDRVRRDQGVPLPRSYELFLALLGRDGGGLMGGTSVCYREIAGIRREALAILDDYRDDRVGQEEVFRLPDDAVVISMHQGYAFELVRSSLGDDPPVEWWAEGSGTPAHATVGFASIADWLEAHEHSTALSPERMRDHRLSSQTSRRRAFRPEPCPSCGGELQWGGRIEYRTGMPDSGRHRSIAVCATEGKSFWRWGNEPNTPMQPE